LQNKLIQSNLSKDQQRSEIDSKKTHNKTLNDSLDKTKSEISSIIRDKAQIESKLISQSKMLSSTIVLNNLKEKFGKTCKI